MKKIAVTGANGMTGAHMVSLLKRKKIPFKPITRKDWDLTKWMSFNEFDKIFDSVKVIFHFGAQLPSNQFTKTNELNRLIFDANIRACTNLAEWATVKNIPIVFLSATLVYKKSHGSKIIESDEKVVDGFGGFYGYSKRLSEDIFEHFSKQGLRCIILRPSSIYGYGLSSEKLIPNFINLAKSGKKLKITGANNRINLIHAYDVVNAVFKAYEANSWGIFNIGSNKSSSIKEIAEIAISIANNGSIEIIDNSDSSNGYLRFDLDSNLAKESFGFDPEVNLREGMMLMKNKSLLL